MICCSNCLILLLFIHAVIRAILIVVVAVIMIMVVVTKTQFKSKELLAIAEIV